MFVEEGQKPVTVLVVEDNEVDVEAIERAFKRERIANPMIVARDGFDALELLRGGKVPDPFIILLDLNMPRMDGLTFLSKLRQDDELSSSVVFVVTTSDDERDLDEAYRHNVAGYVVKGQIGDDFLRLTGLLDNYWRVVTLPH